MKTLDEVKAEIEPILKQQKAQDIAQKQTEDLAGSRRRRRDWMQPRLPKACPL